MEEEKCWTLCSAHHTAAVTLKSEHETHTTLGPLTVPHE